MQLFLAEISGTARETPVFDCQYYFFLASWYVFFLTAAPQILLDIIDLTDERRDVANFTCQAFGDPAPDINWFFNGAILNVSDISKYRIESRLLNTTTAESTLAVYNITFSDVGIYACNATNTIGSDFQPGKIKTVDSIIILMNS